VEAVSCLVNGVGESVLYNSLQAEWKKQPDADLELILTRVARRVVPPSVPGSPQYHQQGLQDLLAIVAEHGMPTFFLTLTADEVSDMRWPEVKDFEDLCNKMGFGRHWTWQDMPAEMATLFYARVQHFLKAHLLHNTDPVLGKVNHYTVRYESQVRRAATLPGLCIPAQCSPHNGPACPALAPLPTLPPLPPKVQPPVGHGYLPATVT
jgi:hypothetical protein